MIPRILYRPRIFIFITFVLFLSSPAFLMAGDIALDVNTATIKQLEALPGIGKETAKRIVEFRDAKGPFKNLEELQHVKGIGKAKLAKLQDKLTVSIAAQSPASK
jgi:competence protein ComEA